MFPGHSTTGIPAHDGALLSVTLSYMVSVNLEVRVTSLVGVILAHRFPWIRM
jgi:hypothetical protein